MRANKFSKLGLFKVVYVLTFCNAFCVQFVFENTDEFHAYASESQIQSPQSHLHTIKETTTLSSGATSTPIQGEIQASEGVKDATAKVEKAAVVNWRLANRSVVTVGHEVYTAWDVMALLAYWKILTKEALHLQTNWLEWSGGLSEEKVDVQSLLVRLPPDVTRFMFIALVWAESRRLNLFEPSEKEFQAAMEQTSKVKWKEVSQSLGEAYGFLSEFPESSRRRYVELVLRARTYERVRGDLRKNLALMNTPWFWHALPVNSRAPAVLPQGG